MALVVFHCRQIGRFMAALACFCLALAAGPGWAETNLNATSLNALVPPAPVSETAAAQLAAPEALFEAEAPSAPAAQALGTGIASYYADRFHGRRTASGEAYDRNALTAAHRDLPFGSVVRVTNPRNGQSVTVRINDRGPFTHGRSIDLSRAAAAEIGLIAAGHGVVELELLQH